MQRQILPLHGFYLHILSQRQSMCHGAGKSVLHHNYADKNQPIET